MLSIRRAACLLVLFTALCASLAFAPQSSPNPARPRGGKLYAAEGEPAAVVSGAVLDNDVMVFSKSTCPFCKKTKTLLDGLGIDYGLIELNERDDGPDIQLELAMATGQRTVPNVFVKGHHVGGNDDTQKAASDGSLTALLEGPRKE
eukprot:CAMPEP_0119536136 /NCGR_PEP_ID=MMETSP1344-20130328/49035_1 /TAXON_ID=236787 /ORGANISM="Florenciella parvula, Strain CCMP2471" /LENGTH=146 /DNA_ID=CAMNT_0007578053 /DNA_START=36 /DNA_END=476 /DNA_ORIENTATION=+